MFQVQMDEEHYRLVGPDGEEGDIVPYGQRATLDIGDEIYTCLVTDPDDEAPLVFHVDEVTQELAEIEEVALPAEIIAAAKRLDAAIERYAAEHPAVELEQDDGEGDQPIPVN